MPGARTTQAKYGAKIPSGPNTGAKAPAKKASPAEAPAKKAVKKGSDGKG
jgi:hypothetical protein